MAAKKNTNVAVTETENEKLEQYRTKEYLVPVEVSIRTTYYVKSNGLTPELARDVFEDQIHGRFTNAVKLETITEGEHIRKQLCQEIETNAVYSTDTQYSYSVGFDNIIHQR
jgi:hypothetical protein